jgi:regulator of sirC expression with transglutaminase-like and TPR domain
MQTEPDYANDVEFRKLVVRQSDVDLTRVALELARDAYPDLDLSEPLEWIEERAEELKPGLAARDDLETLLAMSECLSEQYGLAGSPEAYEAPDSSYLQKVIETGRGIPISLSVIYMAVAEELELPLAGVSAPMHFLARLETSQGAMFVDAYSRGKVLTLSECVDWLQRLTHMPEGQILASLEPVGPRAIIVRMLNNLKVIYVKREDWQAAWKVQHRLATLQSSSYHERRDLGIISLHAGRYSLAVDVLTACQAKCPPEEQEILEGHLKEAHRQLSEWN